MPDALASQVAAGEVAWQLGESIGIFFLEPISQRVVRHYAMDDWMLRSDWSMATWRTRTWLRSMTTSGVR